MPGVLHCRRGLQRRPLLKNRRQNGLANRLDLIFKIPERLAPQRLGLVGWNDLGQRLFKQFHQPLARLLACR